MSSAPVPPANGSGHTVRGLAVLYPLSVVWGVRHVYPWQPSALDLLVPIVVAGCLCWWAVTDARRRGHPIPMLSREWFFLFAWVVVPGYVFWSRGWRGVGWLLLNVVLWYVMAVVAMIVGGLAVYGDGWLRLGGP